MSIRRVARVLIDCPCHTSFRRVHCNTRYNVLSGMNFTFLFTKNKLYGKIWNNNQKNRRHPVSNHPDSGHFAAKQLPPKCKIAFGVNQTPATRRQTTRIQAALHQNGCLQNAKPHLESTKPPPPRVKSLGLRPFCTKTVASKMQNRIWSQPNTFFTGEKEKRDNEKD